MRLVGVDKHVRRYDRVLLVRTAQCLPTEEAAGRVWDRATMGYAVPAVVAAQAAHIHLSITAKETHT